MKSGQTVTASKLFPCCWVCCFAYTYAVFFWQKYSSEDVLNVSGTISLFFSASQECDSTRLNFKKQLDLFLHNFTLHNYSLICVKQIAQPKTVLSVPTSVTAVWEVAQLHTRVNTL